VNTTLDSIFATVNPLSSFMSLNAIFNSAGNMFICKGIVVPLNVLVMFDLFSCIGFLFIMNNVSFCRIMSITGGVSILSSRTILLKLFAKCFVIFWNIFCFTKTVSDAISELFILLSITFISIFSTSFFQHKILISQIIQLWV